MEIKFKRERETKNTVRYQEMESGQALVIGTLYIQKWASSELEDPETIIITVKSS